GLRRAEAASAAQVGRRVFHHGVASGDPLTDRVILWTRVTTPAQTPPEVRWEVSRNAAFTRIVTRGMTRTGAARDFTVKIDAVGLAPATTYYYRFETLGERSPVGRTRTLPGSDARRVRLALASCSNLPFGYFNVYRRIAARADLDAVLHLGDYIYEYPNGRYGDGTPFGRVPRPDREIVALADYRMRHAQYRSDPDLQEVHRQHPFIVVWDDHEITNNAWRDGAENHNPDLGEGEYAARRAAAVQAYLEWMPIREDPSTRLPRIYRSFAFGDLVDLIMLDTRLVDRDEQAERRESIAVIDDPKRSLLGRAQEAWLFAELAASKRANVTWQLLGQQVMFAPCSLPGANAVSTDTWDGYRYGRQRIIDAIAGQKLPNVVVLTGDVHSSWGYDIAQNPWDGYDPATGRGTLAVEIVTPAVTSPSGFANEGGAERMASTRKSRPHLRYLEGLRRGYVVLDVTRERAQADWYFVPTVTVRTRVEEFGKGLVTEAGNPHLVEAASAVPARQDVDEPAPHTM
ncbi:MAG: alkaline phosphatase D family protein, partial [Vicinamibacterales bacterium]